MILKCTRGTFVGISMNCFKQEVYSFPHLSSPTRADSYIHRQCNHPCAQHRCEHQGIRHRRTVSTQPALSRAPARPTSVRLRIKNHPAPPAQPTSTQPASMHASIQPTSAQALRTTSANAVRNARTPEAPTRPTPTLPPTRPASTQASVHPASTHASIQPTPTAPSLHPLSSAAVPGPEGLDSG